MASLRWKAYLWSEWCDGMRFWPPEPNPRGVVLLHVAGLSWGWGFKEWNLCWFVFLRTGEGFFVKSRRETPSTCWTQGRVSAGWGQGCGIVLWVHPALSVGGMTLTLISPSQPDKLVPSHCWTRCRFWIVLVRRAGACFHTLTNACVWGEGSLRVCRANVCVCVFSTESTYSCFGGVLMFVWIWVLIWMCMCVCVCVCVCLCVCVSVCEELLGTGCCKCVVAWCGVAWLVTRWVPRGPIWTSILTRQMDPPMAAYLYHKPQQGGLRHAETTVFSSCCIFKLIYGPSQ